MIRSILGHSSHEKRTHWTNDMNATTRKLLVHVSTLLIGITLVAAFPGCSAAVGSSDSPQGFGQTEDAGQTENAGQTEDAGQTAEPVGQTAEALVNSVPGSRPSTTNDAINFWASHAWPNYGYGGQWTAIPYYRWVYPWICGAVPSLNSHCTPYQVLDHTDYIFGGGTFGDRGNQLRNFLRGLHYHGNGPFTFTEYDITFYPHRSPRNAERIVRCNETGTIFYTSDHYANFTMIST
ncbi:MAG: hypothetical protein M3O50_00085 [Myxococcota bacterium]|nr:hypothetical protein [Myxococcota bacterium]